MGDFSPRAPGANCDPKSRFAIQHRLDLFNRILVVRINADYGATNKNRLGNIDWPAAMPAVWTRYHGCALVAVALSIWTKASVRPCKTQTGCASEDLLRLRMSDGDFQTRSDESVSESLAVTVDCC